MAASSAFPHTIPIGRAKSEDVRVDSVSILDDVPIRRCPWHRFDNLLRSPSSRRVGRDIDVENSSARKAENDEHEQQMASNRRRHCEIDGDHR